MEFLGSAWRFLQEQILGMHWLDGLIDRGLFALGLDTSTRWGGSIFFFFTMSSRLRCCSVS